MLAGALQCANETVAKPLIAIRSIKQAMHYARDHSVDEALKPMAWLQDAIWSNRHGRASVSAIEDKPPIWLSDTCQTEKI